MLDLILILVYYIINSHMHILHTLTHAHTTHTHILHTLTYYTHSHTMHILYTLHILHTHTCTYYTHSHMHILHTLTHAHTTHTHPCTYYTHSHTHILHTLTHAHTPVHNYKYLKYEALEDGEGCGYYSMETKYDIIQEHGVHPRRMAQEIIMLQNRNSII